MLVGIGLGDQIGYFFDRFFDRFFNIQSTFVDQCGKFLNHLFKAGFIVFLTFWSFTKVFKSKSQKLCRNDLDDFLLRFQSGFIDIGQKLINLTMIKTLRFEEVLEDTIFSISYPFGLNAKKESKAEFS